MRLIRPLLAALVLFPACVHAQSTTQQVLKEEIRSHVDSLITATNYDVMGTMDLYVRSPRVSSVNDERIVQGWSALYRETRAAVPSQGSFFVRVGEVDVTSMGTDHALAVAPMTMEYDTECGGVQLPGSMTLAFERTPAGWKILHEHYSTGVDPNALARIAAQGNRGDDGMTGLLRLLLMGMSGDLLGLAAELLDTSGGTCAGA